MKQYERQRHKILVAGDCALNRNLLNNMLEDRYELEHADSGAQVVSILQQRASEFSLLLLDLHVPELDSFDVLAYMNRYHWIEDVPVVMIAGKDLANCVDRAYGLGVTDFIRRPFDASMVRSRVRNTLLLSARQRGLRAIVDDQVREKKRSNELMVSILSHIVECHNGESGLHVQHIGIITELLLRSLVQKTRRYDLSEEDISLMVAASGLHDIGKIAIPDEVLNKPGELTPEERKLIKSHAMAGAEMLASLPEDQWEEPLVRAGYEICRWHHERYDGGGYPDGLKGDDIPISAQVVSLADVYDALTSKRCYKDAYSHERAIEMIRSGQCGAFNPLLLECLEEQGPAIWQAVQDGNGQDGGVTEMDRVDRRLRDFGLSASERLARQLDLERQQFQFLYENSQEALFWYTVSPSLLHVNETCQKMLGLDSTIVDPKKDEILLRTMGSGALRAVLDSMYHTTPGRPETSVDIQMEARGCLRQYRVSCRTIWPPDGGGHYAGMVGRLVEVEGDRDPNGGGRTFRRARELVRNGVCTMTHTEAQVAMEYLGVIFETVRLVDADSCCLVEVGQDGCIVREDRHCYDLWGRTQRCDNCTCAKCVASKAQASKLEHKDETIYRVMSCYLEVDGRPYALEMADQVRDVDDILEGYSKHAVLQAIESHNRTLYIDPVTRVYNRRYYEDQLCHLTDIRTVAMMDVDSFKEINDTWGHQAGDVALSRIAQAIRDCVRATDPVVRYGGDEFVVIFRDIPEEVFRRKLTEIQDMVSAIRVEAYPEMRCAVSIGGCYGSGTVSQLLSQADREMYRNKRDRKSHLPLS